MVEVKTRTRRRIGALLVPTQPITFPSGIDSAGPIPMRAISPKAFGSLDVIP